MKRKLKPSRRTLLYLAVAFALAAMAGCSSMPRTVDVPLAVPCVIELPPAPAWATDTLSPTSTRFERVRALLAEREQARGYIIKLEAAARACAGS